jgi:hypothetical protein
VKMLRTGRVICGGAPVCGIFPNSPCGVGGGAGKEIPAVVGVPGENGLLNDGAREVCGVGVLDAFPNSPGVGGGKSDQPPAVPGGAGKEIPAVVGVPGENGLLNDGAREVCGVGVLDAFPNSPGVGGGKSDQPLAVPGVG